MTVKTSISLTDEQDRYARELVEAGHFSSLSAVLQRGLDMLRRENDIHEAEIESMRALIKQRRDGAFVTLAQGKSEITAMLVQKRSARGTV